VISPDLRFKEKKRKRSLSLARSSRAKRHGAAAAGVPETSTTAAHSSQSGRPPRRFPSLQGTPRLSQRPTTPQPTRPPPRGGTRWGTNAQTDVLLVEARSAICVQRLDDSLNSAIHTRYRSLLRSSSMHEPRGPPLEVVLGLVSRHGETSQQQSTQTDG